MKTACHKVMLKAACWCHCTHCKRLLCLVCCLLCSLSCIVVLRSPFPAPVTKARLPANEMSMVGEVLRDQLQ